MSTKKQKNLKNLKEMCDFGKRLHKLRVGSKLSQRGLAEKLKFTAHTHISKVESGDGELTVSALREMSKALNVDLHWLITGQASPNLKALADALRVPAQQLLSQLNQKIRERRSEIANYQLSGIFNTEGNEDKMREAEEKLGWLQAEYDTLSRILTVALKDSEGGC